MATKNVDGDIVVLVDFAAAIIGDSNDDVQ